MPEKNRFANINVKTINNVFRKREKKLTRRKVLKMLAVMEASQSAAGPSNSASNAPPTPDGTTHVQEFLSSGRTGRRNALPDILGQHAVVTSSDLTTKLQGLTTSDKPPEDPHNQPGSSKS